jgi:hypothetical protein
MIIMIGRNRIPAGINHTVARIESIFMGMRFLGKKITVRW